MSWNFARPVEEVRAEFLRRMSEGQASVRALCREYGISPKTAYKWKSRQAAGGPLHDQSRRPKTTPNATSGEMVSEIFSLRKAHPTLGGAKISIMLKNRGLEGVPSGSTVTEILRRRNLLDPRAVAVATHLVRYVKSRPNEMWQMDFKGHFLLDSGERCHPLNVIDDYSRYAVVSAPVHHETFVAIKPILISAFRTNGLPESILYDNGNPWGTAQKNGITAFEAWAMELDILTLHGRPVHPQTQGKNESFNKSWKREVLLKLGPRPDFVDVMTATEAFRSFYNDERPHFGIGGKCPGELYRKSEREYVESVSEWSYDGDCTVKYVNCKGYVSMESGPVYVGEGLCGKRIAVRPSSTHPDCVSLLFRNFRIGRINMATGKLEYLRVYRLDEDPRQGKATSTSN